MPFSVSLISCSRSAELVQASSFAWKSSSATPAQLRASAREPVQSTCLRGFVCRLRQSLDWQTVTKGSVHALTNVCPFAKGFLLRSQLCKMVSGLCCRITIAKYTIQIVVCILSNRCRTARRFKCRYKFCLCFSVFLSCDSSANKSRSSTGNCASSNFKPVLAASPILLNPVLNFSRDTPLLLTNPSTSLLALLIALLVCQFQQ